MFDVVISGHNGILNVKSNAALTPFQAASTALRVAGTDLPYGHVTVIDGLDGAETFEFLRVDDMLAIV